MVKPVTVESKVVLRPCLPDNKISVGGIELILVGADAFTREQSGELDNLMEDLKRKQEKRQIMTERYKRDVKDRYELVKDENDDEDPLESNALTLNERMFKSVSTEGYVVSIPVRLGRDSFNEPYGNKVMVEAGDHVFFHPNTTRPVSDIGHEGLFCTSYEMLFAKRLPDGSISMIGDNCFCEPIMESEEDIKTLSGIYIKPEPGSKLMRAILRHVGHVRKQERIYFRDFYLEPGMEIIYAQNSDIPITIGEQKFVRMKIEDIVAVMINGNPVMMNRYLMLIQDEAKTEEGSLIIPGSIQNRPNTGVIVRSGKGVHLEGAFTGDRVWFYDKGLMKFEWEGVEYGFIDVNYCYAKEGNVCK